MDLGSAFTGSPMVSVVLTCYNYGRYLRRATTSVLGQTLSDIELVIVDDGSTDESRQMALKCADDHPEWAISVLLVRNGGLARARNLGIALTRGQFVCCLDADDWFAPTAMEKMVAAFEEDPTLSVVRPSMQNFGTRNDVLEMEPYEPRTLAVTNIAPYSSMFRRVVWLEVGGYDETMPAYEDWNFWISASEHGCKMGSLSEPVFHYRNSTDGMFARVQDRDLELRARIVLNHPRTYDRACQDLAARVLAGEDVGPDLLADDVSEVFACSPSAKQLRAAWRRSMRPGRLSEADSVDQPATNQRRLGFGDAGDANSPTPAPDQHIDTDGMEQ